jgi:hypothetical protein
MHRLALRERCSTIQRATNADVRSITIARDRRGTSSARAGRRAAPGLLCGRALTRSRDFSRLVVVRRGRAHHAVRLRLSRHPA